MAAKKLSEIVHGTPTANDFVVGVTAGNLDRLFATSAIGLVPAPSNLDFYVATTGSDSNPGTISQPFATVQHATVIASKYDYQGLYWPTIHVAAGTYGAPTIVLPELTNIAEPTSGGVPIVTFGAVGIVRGAGVALTSLLDTSGFGVIQATGGRCTWAFDALTLESDVCGLQANAGAAIGTLLNGTIGFGNSNGIFGTDNPTAVAAFLDGLVQMDQTTITMQDTATGPLIRMDAIAFVGQPGGSIVVTNSTINLPGTNYGSSAWIDTFAINNIDCTLWGHTYVNASSWQGGTLSAGNAGVHSFLTDNAGWSQFPGGGVIAADLGVISSNVFSSPARSTRWHSNQISGLPVATTNLNPQQWGLFKDTSGGGVYVAYNDAGTIKKVALV